MSVAVVGSASGASGSSLSSFTVSVTVLAGTNVLSVQENNANAAGGLTPTSVTYNGVNLTMVPSSSVISNQFESSIWYLINPPTGTAFNLVANYSAAQNFFALGGIFLSGVNTSSPVGTAATNSGTTVAGGSVAPTGAGANGLYIGTCFAFGTTLSSGGSQTNQWNQNAVGGLLSGSGDTATNGNSFTWTAGGSTDNWTASGVAFLPSSSGAVVAWLV
jgi:hypothetical protein